MILFKKSHAEQLLQLALALSLLRVNPDNYLGYGWQSQLVLNNGDGLQLELQAAPVYDDYPYANRKAIIPIIEDLVRFDRHRYTNSYDIQTYLLNIQNEQTTDPIPQSNDTSPVIQESIHHQSAEPVAAFNDLDLFLNADQFNEATSILDLNLADLNDYSDEQLQHPYQGLPLKDEPLDIYDDFRFRAEEAASTSSDLFGASLSSTPNDFNRFNYSRIVTWTELHDNLTKIKQETEVKEEVAEKKQEVEEGAVKLEAVTNETEIKLERHDADEDAATGDVNFHSSVELTEEVKF